MPWQLEDLAGVAQVACFDPVDLKIAVGKIGDVEIFAFRAEGYAFSKPTSLCGPDLTDLSSFRGQDVEQRIWGGKPSLLWAHRHCRLSRPRRRAVRSG